MKAKRSRLILFILAFTLSAASSGLIYAEEQTSSPYDRKIAYIGGLSRQLFSGDRNDVTIATEMFFDEVIKRIGMEDAEFVVLDSKQSVLQAMQEDRLDTVFANPIDYLDFDHQINPKHRYTLSFGPNPEQRIYLLTNSKDKIKDIRALRNKRLSIPNGYILGEIFLDVYLAKSNLPRTKQFFTTIARPNSSNAAVLDIFFGKADLAVTSDVAYALANELNSQLHTKVDILDISDPYIPFVIGVNKRVPASLTDPVDAILTDLKHEPRLRNILSMFSATDVVKVNDKQLETLIKLKNDYNRLIEPR